MHSVDYVVRLCQHLADQGVRHIMFTDDLFTVRKERVIELCHAFIEQRFRFTWSCSSHPNLLDFETLCLMKEAGCWQIAYGIESGSQRMLDLVKREVKLPRLRETLRMTRAAGIRTKGYVMLGHPTEGLDSIEETAAFLSEVELDMCQITKFTPYPGTPAYATIQQYGTFAEDWEQMNGMNFIFIPHGLSAEILEASFHRLYKVFYRRPDVLRGLARLMVQQPRYLERFGRAAVHYLQGRWSHFRRRSHIHTTDPVVAN